MDFQFIVVSNWLVLAFPQSNLLVCNPMRSAMVPFDYLIYHMAILRGSKNIATASFRSNCSIKFSGNWNLNFFIATQNGIRRVF
jgi:hypothetical protein